MQRALQNLCKKQRTVLQIALNHCEELCCQVGLRGCNQSILNETKRRFKAWDKRENCAVAVEAVGRRKKKHYQYLHLLTWGEDYFFFLQLARENDKNAIQYRRKL